MDTRQMSAFFHRLARGMAAETMGDQSDRDLVERFLANRDDTVFEAIVRRHGPMIFRVCWRVLQDEQEAEDAMQATFLVLAQKLHTVRKRTSLASWLHGVAHRVALKAKSQVASRERHERQACVSGAVPSDDVTWKELRAVLDAELAQMAEKWRLPLILCYLEGRTQDEAAAQLGCGERTLRRRLEEARAALGRRLCRRGIVWPAALFAVLLSECVAPAAIKLGVIRSTVEIAAHVLAGQATAAVVPAKIAALAEGVMKAMFISKLKVVGGILLVLGIFAAGVGALTQTTLAARQPESEAAARANGRSPTDQKTPPGKEADQPKTDHNSIQGIWQVVEVRRADGGNQPHGDFRTHMRKLGRLPAELVNAKKSDAEIVNALFRASLNKNPGDSARAAMTKYLEGAKDRTQKSRDILFSLVSSQEFLKLHDLDGNIDEATQLINELSAEWDKKTDFQKLTVEITKDRFAFKPGMINDFSYKLDPSKKPKHIDTTLLDGPAKGTVVDGLYSLKGDELTISLGIKGAASTRPTDIKDGRLYLVLSRQKADEQKTDKERFQGTWQCVSVSGGGETIKVKDFGQNGLPGTVKFDGDKLLSRDFNSDGKVVETKGSFKLDPSRKPKEIDLIYDPETKVKNVQGLYELKGDSLRLCFPGPPDKERPTKLESKEGDRYMLITYRRVAKDVAR